VLPAKLVTNPELVREIAEKKKIPCIHLQLNPTNRCNLRCPMCSCSKRDRRHELSYENIMEIMSKAKRAGCESVTITGGGEPLMHPRIYDIIHGIKDMGIEIGFVTNGTMLHQVPAEVFSRITWIRISSADHRAFPKRYINKLDAAVDRGGNVDWSFSHIVTQKPNYKTIKALVKFANSHAFTHIRLVSDLLDLDAARDMDTVKSKLREAGINDDIVIYQGRKEFELGTKKCYISLLKPVVTADGRIVACCGWQYRKEKASRDYDAEDSMCDAKDIDKLYEMQKYFDGSACSKCYYMNYNRTLKILLSDLKHKRFV